MGTIKTILDAIKIFVHAYEFLTNKITETIFLGKVREIRSAHKRAQEGSLEDRLKGGKDVENIYNDNVDND